MNDKPQIPEAQRAPSSINTKNPHPSISYTTAENQMPRKPWKNPKEGESCLDDRGTMIQITTGFSSEPHKQKDSEVKYLKP